MVIKWFRLMLCLFYFPFDITVEVILRRIYNNNEIKTSITKKETKKLILLCTKVVHFTFHGKTYVQL